MNVVFSLHLLLSSFAASSAFSPSTARSAFRRPFAIGDDSPRPRSYVTAVHMAGKIGVFFGTSTGSTQSAAELIAEEFGNDVAAGPIEIDTIQGKVADEFAKYDALVVGTPTWNTGADTERSGTGWDEVYYSEMQDLNISGKKVAVFGLGDSVSYAENYADASGELHDVFENLGCKMMGYTSQEGYEHESSKAIRGDLFCGLLLDAVNQEDLTEGRVKKWVEQLIAEGILESVDSTDSPSLSTPPVSPDAVETSTQMAEVLGEDTSAAMAELEKENERLTKMLEEKTQLINKDVAANGSAVSGTGYTPHYNAITGTTMWTSPDGRSCYFTSEKP